MNYEDLEFALVNCEHSELTYACIKSINAQCTNVSYIRVFDNSSKKQFENIFSNVEVISNFNNEVFVKEPSFGGDTLHSLAIKHLIKTCKKKYMVLCDSDVVFKKDLDFLNDSGIDSYASVFEQLVIKKDHVNRALPFLQLFNIGMLRKHNVEYYPEHIKTQTDYYTGQFFLRQLILHNLKYKLIQTCDYINHLQYVRRRSCDEITAFIKQNEKHYIPHFYVITPFAVSGGPENLQQIASAIKVCGYQSSVVYLNNSIMHKPQFAKYKNAIDCMKNIDDNAKNYIIIPEYINLRDIKKIISKRRCKNIIAWLSIDNCKNLHDADTIQSLLNQNNVVASFAQSYYAYKYLSDHDVSNVCLVSDYINDEFVSYASHNLKCKCIAYNPKKGNAFTQKIINALPQMQFIRLENMNPQQLCDALDKSMIYIDFGNHPGKDRIPREACCRNCIVMTSKLGSANNSYDVPIPDEYKFDTTDSSAVNVIVQKIQHALDNYDAEILKYKAYKDVVLQQKAKFYDEVALACKKILHLK